MTLNTLVTHPYFIRSKKVINSCTSNEQIKVAAVFLITTAYEVAYEIWPDNKGGTSKYEIGMRKNTYNDFKKYMYQTICVTKIDPLRKHVAEAEKSRRKRKSIYVLD